ncbi:MAG: hypothetical protein PUF50_06490 [Erysipelotrichaceae bacterium]|nr:hypothetical protein [Erysipelotrichaceae bacterium]
MSEKKGYQDIIDLPHHQSKKHPHMSNHDRAAQFSPFAALTGHGSAIKETARRTEQKVELDEYEKAVLDQKLQEILQKRSWVKVTFFEPDLVKDGGEYVEVIDQFKKVDRYRGEMVLMNHRILLANIMDIEKWEE